jgi:glycosyltransferase involved in cell wall biosynthesis
MKFSVFTPSHDLKYIDRPLESLKNQTFKDFEWVLLLNNEAKNERDKLEEKINKLKINYKFVDFFQINNRNIGYLKMECCRNADGEILVELDHDDALEPNCLEELAKKFDETNADFVYSSDYSVRISEEGKEEFQTPFNPMMGWKQGEKDGKKYHPSFEPSPLAFSYIWYAPDHVRAWKKDFYESIGGHDPSMDICDDFDLLCRTYTEGKCGHIPEPLYKYYFHEDNTAYGDKNEKIQELTHHLHDKYIQGMVEKWCDNEGHFKVDLCSCNNKPEGYVGIDKRKLNEEDIEFDLNQPDWPFEDGTVGLFRCQDALEHLKDPINTMKEMHRCLAPLGWALIEVPSTDGRGAFQDPTHVSFWNSNSFWYYTKAQQAHFIGTPVKFQLNRVLDYFPSDWHKFHNIKYTKAHLVKIPWDYNEPLPNGREI